MKNNFYIYIGFSTSSFHYRPKINEDDDTRSDISSQRVIKRKVLRLEKKRIFLEKKHRKVVLVDIIMAKQLYVMNQDQVRFI